MIINDKKLDVIIEKLNTLEKKISEIELSLWTITQFQQAENSFDPLIPEVGLYLSELDFIDASDLQRKFNIGYARSARILDQLIESNCIEDIANHNKKRKVIRDNIKNIIKKDFLFSRAIEIIMEHDMVSASLLQRRLSIGYARAARLMDQLESERYISSAEGAKPRKVLKKS